MACQIEVATRNLVVSSDTDGTLLNLLAACKSFVQDKLKYHGICDIFLFKIWHERRQLIKRTIEDGGART